MNRESPYCRVWAIIACVLSGCWQASEHEVAVYSALDAQFSAPVLDQFSRATQIEVLGNFDIESTKTVGLVTRIIGEKQRPRCDVFWNNEILHTIRLQKMGLLDSYASPAGARLPENYRSSSGHWYGFAARARVLLVNTQLVPERSRPTSIRDLVEPAWKGRVGVAKPLFGTTATHACVLFAHWGRPEAEAFFRKLKINARIMAGNKHVALAVSHGDLAFGLTDTDDAIAEVDDGWPVEIVFPDQEGIDMGTLFIPNTLCLIKGGPNPIEARRLIDYLLDPNVEAGLAKGKSAQFPIDQRITTRPRAAQESIRWMDVDFEDAAEQWDTVAPFLRDLFATAGSRTGL